MAIRDVLTFGETMLRFSPPGRQRFAQANGFDVWIAGSESNVAVALHILGLAVTWAGRLPNNIVGRKIEAELQAHGLETAQIVWASPDERIGTFYLEPGAAPRATRVVYDRAHSAASHMTPADLPDALFDTHRHLHLSGITPALSSTCVETVSDAISRAKARGRSISFDVNYRALLWPPEEAAKTLEPLLAQADVIFSTRDDAARLFGITGDDAAVAADLRKRFGVSVVALTTGADGAIACDSQGCQSVPALPVETTVDRIGSGDAFAAGFLAGYLSGSIEHGLRLGVAAAALKRTVPGDMLVATRAEIEAVMAQENAKPWR
jgi:2-dehydro-3-deoxygluconokinase